MTPESPTAEREGAYRQLIAAVGTGCEDVVDDLLSPDFVDHNAVLGQPPGPEGFKLWIRGARSAFPDLVGTVEDVLSDAERVAGRVTYRGTHGGDFLGIRATGRAVAFEAFHIIAFENRRIVEWWGAADLLGALLQCGASVTLPTDE
jgi:predicted ester cyclase